jgi:glutaredoxin
VPVSDRAIVLYSVRDCPQCEAARTFLRDHGFDFVDIDVRENIEALRSLATLAGQAVVPTIVCGDDVQVGWDAARVTDMLANPLPAEEEDLLLLFDDDEDDAPRAPEKTERAEDAEEDDAEG